MGRPKALVEVAGRPLLNGALDALRAGGCGPLLVVLGAAAEQADALVPDDVTVVLARDWAEGMGASLRAGLDALQDTDAVAAVVHLVDLPGVGGAAIARLAGEAGAPSALARAAYHGRPGHPVLLGREHWAGVRASATGDSGARGYLAGHPDLRLVECADLADPRDVDTEEALRAFHRPARP
jgi:CTP:molybdopterin cytidylyltransferase MocA